MLPARHKMPTEAVLHNAAETFNPHNQHCKCNMLLFQPVWHPSTMATSQGALADAEPGG